MQIYIPFKERFREPMLNGAKILTTRSKPYGQTGDWFNAFGRTFTLLWVKRLPLAYAVANWKLEGCSSTEDFLAVWKEIHPRKPINQEEEFWVHSFQDISRKGQWKAFLNSGYAHYFLDGKLAPVCNPNWLQIESLPNDILDRCPDCLRHNELASKRSDQKAKQP